MAEVSDIDSSVLDYNSKNFNEYLKGINEELEDVDKLMNKEAYQETKPSGIIDRVFIDLFGVVGLYLMLFILSDFTRVILTGDQYFGIKWIFWGPYYYLTSAPLLTRVWESKKFLKDLAEVEGDADFTWPDNNSCSTIGSTYKKNCEEGETRNHPIRDKMGDGLDWLIRHTIGKHFGGILGNANCTDQSTTIANDCAFDRVKALWGAYNGFCDMYPTMITHRATDMNWPNTVSMNSGYISQFTDNDKAAYQMYYEGYLKIYDIGSTVFTGHGTPENLNPAYDSENFYCFNANKLWGVNGYGNGDSFWYLGFPIPGWYTEALKSDFYGNPESYKYNQRLFQLNYQQHRYDVQ